MTVWTSVLVGSRERALRVAPAGILSGNGRTRFFLCDTAAELPSNVSDGDLAWAKDTDLFYGYSGSAWVTIGGTLAWAPAGADYLVGTAQAGLSAEIVVGTAPGGELGGSWASPTVGTSGVWTPTPTGLTVVGTPTYTGTYYKVGRLVFLTLRITSTTTTQSTEDTTYFSGMPFNAAEMSTCAAVNGVTSASYGVGRMLDEGSNQRLYVPTWPAVADVLVTAVYRATA